MAHVRRPRPRLGTDGQWHAWVEVGERPDGTAKRRHVKRDDEASCEAEVDRLMDAVKTGRVVKAGQKPTVQSWLTTYLTTIAPRRCTPDTVYDYESKMRNWVYPTYGAKRLERLAPEDLDAIYLAMAAAKKAPSHQLKVHRILSRALDIAERRGLVGRNVAKLIDAPSAPRVNVQALEEETGLQILEVAKKRRNTERWSVAFAVGLRQGEALGLRWEDPDGIPLIDLDHGIMRVWYQLRREVYRHGCGAEKGGAYPCGRKRGAECPQRSEGGLHYRKCKGKSQRTIPIPPELVGPLRALRARQAQERLRLGDRWLAGEAVFTTEHGTVIDPRDDHEEWTSILVEAGVKHVKLHISRHTAAMILLAQGVDIRVVQVILGHTDIRTTQGYTQSAEMLMAEAVKRSILRAPGKIKGAKKGALQSVV